LFSYRFKTKQRHNKMNDQAESGNRAMSRARVSVRKTTGDRARDPSSPYLSNCHL
jgi:hypothetical protein